jgi:hypothetical protein
MAMLARRELATVAFDQRGHGESGDDTGGHIESFGDDTAAMLENLVAPIVVGASLGGFAALMALRARTVRDNVAGLVLVDVIPDPDPAIVRPFLASVGRNLVESSLVQDIFDHADTLRKAASLLDLPFLLVRAGRGTPISDQAVGRLRVIVPHSQVVTVAEAGHLVARDAPSALADVLTAFLNDDAVRAKRINSMLVRCGCVEIAHPGGNLFAHLNRVAETLRSWKSDPIMVDAARLHAAYGTDGFDKPFVRAASGLTVEAVAGSATSALVALYGACDRRKSYPTWSSDVPMHFDRVTGEPIPLDATTRAQLIELTVANELDVLAHDEHARLGHGAALRNLFAAWKPFMRDAALRAIETALW